MKNRLNATQWLGIGIAVLALLIGGDWVVRMLRPVPISEDVVKAADPKMVPDFKVGDVAPDFELPDSKEVPHRLSELVKRKTVLSFICGCSNCLDVQSYLGILIKRLGKEAPDVISVTTMPKEREASYRRDTKLKQTLLFERKEGPIMTQYRGHPCPRIYMLNGDRTVEFIGTSPNDVVSVREIGMQMASALGFPYEGPGGPPEAAPTGN